MIVATLPAALVIVVTNNPAWPPSNDIVQVALYFCAHGKAGRHDRSLRSFPEGAKRVMIRSAIELVRFPIILLTLVRAVAH
jgi:hypothetical protein